LEQLNHLHHYLLSKMEKQYAPSAREKKVTGNKKSVEPISAPVKQEEKKEEAVETKTDAVKVEEKTEEKKEDKKKIEVTKKDKAIVQGISLPISPKNCYSICKMIMGKTPETAIEMLEQVLKFKRVVPMNNMEIPHRKGKGIMAGRYPLNASKAIIDLLKQLKANSSVNGIDNPVIVIAKANRASRPYRKEGKRAKRANVYIEVKNKFDKLKTKENK